MALLSIREQQQAYAMAAGRGSGSGSSAVLAAAAAGLSPAGSPPSAGGAGGSRRESSNTNLDAVAGGAGEQPLSPTSRLPPQQHLGAARQPFIEEKRLVQLFKSRVARLGA